MSSPVPRRSWLTSRMVGWVFGMLAAFAVIYYSLPNSDLNGPRGPSLGHQDSGVANSSLCEKKLAKWIQSVDPEKMQFDTDIESRILELNRYWTTCGPQADDPIVSDLKPLEAHLNGDVLQRALSPRFGRRDIEHIRQSLLLSQIAMRIGEAKKTDLERALSALVLISQQTDPLPVESAGVHPLTPFECLLLGQGTPSDRAWIMAEVMRQLHLDAIVLTVDDPAVSPLVGVIIDQDVYLFEPGVGLPVPAAGESQKMSMFQAPATLSAALADDAILRQLDLEGAPFPWTAERLKSAHVGLVGTSCTWAPRMAEIQFQWPTTQPSVTYDGLGASAGKEHGLVARISKALSPMGFEPQSIQVWDYPEQQCTLYDSLGAEAAPHMAPLVAVMSGPSRFEETQDAQTGTWTVTPQRTKPVLQQVRVQQLLGHRNEAIAGYLSMQRAHLASPKKSGRINGQVQQVMDRNRIVADKATFWTAATQFDNKDLGACVGTLKRHARVFPLGEMREAAAMRLAACLSAAQEYQTAADILSGFGPGPNQRRRLLLARRLKELAEASPASSPPAAPEPQPATALPEGTPEPATGTSIPPAPPTTETIPQ